MPNKTEKINLRVSPAEREYLIECAHKDNIDNMSTWIRKTLWAHLALVSDNFYWFFTRKWLAFLRDENNNAMFVSDGAAIYRVPERPESLFESFLSKYLKKGVEVRFANFRVNRDLETGMEQIEELPQTTEQIWANLIPKEKLRKAKLATIGNEPALRLNWSKCLVCTFQTRTGIRYGINYAYYRMLRYVAGETPLVYYLCDEKVVAYDSEGRLWGIIMRIFEESEMRQREQAMKSHQKK